MQRSLFKAFARAAGPVGAVGAISGFLSDVLLPLAKGDHILYVQAIASDGTTTEVVEFPFTVK